MIRPQLNTVQKIQPRCPVFGECGGCSYQDISYSDELKIKEQQLKDIFQTSLGVSLDIFEPIVASPQEYNYRHRLDLKLVRSKSGEFDIGFSPEGRNRLISIKDCAIARQEISDYLPRLREEVAPKLTSKYKLANLVVRAGEDRRVLWGGIGRRSLQLTEDKYLFTTVYGKKIFFSLDTFFQANFFILDDLIERIKKFSFINQEAFFYDLYGGVGLFGISVADCVKKVYLLEENQSSVKAAQYNKSYHKLENLEIIGGRVEDHLSANLSSERGQSVQRVAMIDPPRDGLSESAGESLSQCRDFSHIIYLSCHPESLVRDLRKFLDKKWEILKVIPFDFFPKTKHLETLVVLKRGI